MKVTIGGDRLGSGKKMRADMHGYERSTHDLGNVFTTTLSPGTIVPVYKKVCLPGDSWDIELGTQINTLPSNGPLFSSYKLQIDAFYAATRLYQGLLHMNATGIGNRMNQVKLPFIEMTATVVDKFTHLDIDNSQVNPSSLPAYLGYRGIGMTTVNKTRKFNAVPILMYWDVVKQYYVNQQEQIGWVIHTPSIALTTTVTTIEAAGTQQINPSSGSNSAVQMTQTLRNIDVHYVGAPPIPNQIMFVTSAGLISFEDLCNSIVESPGVDFTLNGIFNWARWGDLIINTWQYKDITDMNTGKPDLVSFPLSNIDDMRKGILGHTIEGTGYDINSIVMPPYIYLVQQPNEVPNILSSQEGLALKTYQSDIYQNWLRTEWIEDIATKSAVSTATGSFTQDQLILSKKIYDMMNRIAVSGGTYYDWIDVTYTNDGRTRHETPIYLGGLIKEIVFGEVISNSESQTESGTQPLGTLAGKGMFTQKHKGGKIHCKTDEHGYIMIVASITPRLYYTQGNDWDINLESMDDYFKPALDQIGFQDSINEYRAWWTTRNVTDEWVQTASGKIPAWIDYMTSVNKALGNFAIANNQMFMILARRYQLDTATDDIKDLTTYIDPSNYNYIFAQAELDAQNFWLQVAIDAQVRRIMSGKLMPNL